MTTIRHLVVDRSNPTETRIASSPVPVLAAGETLFRIDRVAMTANNVTYAAIAHLIPYFEFFPSPVEGFGCLPVWGFAEVIESATEDVTVGERCFGFWPASTHVVMQPDRVDAATVVDRIPHREPLPPVYNSYSSTDGDRTYRADREDVMCVFRPLFMTAFSIDESLGAAGFSGAERVVLSSASSKTAWATAHLLEAREGLEIVGLTSQTNVDFVRGLGVYERIVTYGDVAALADGVATAYVDYAGSEPLRRELRRVMGDDLVFDLSVGIAHWADVGGQESWADPPITRYFAPSTIRQRMEEVGASAYMKMYGAAWDGFAPDATGSLEFEEHGGIDAMRDCYTATAAGTVSPDRGLIIRPGG